MQIQPVNDHVWISRAEAPDRTDGGLLVPDAVRRASPCQYGTVVAVGPACKEVKVGDTAYFDEAESRQVLIEGAQRQVFVVIPEECIYGRKSA